MYTLRCSPPVRIYLERVEELKTNLQNKGLISVDRGTRPLTYVQYLVLYLSRIQRICYSRYLNLFSSIVCSSFCGTTVPLQFYDLGPKAMLTHVTSGNKNVSPLFSMDSGLEAFSRNPTHGSFSALTFQSTEFAKYVNQRFLSY